MMEWKYLSEIFNSNESKEDYKSDYYNITNEIEILLMNCCDGTRRRINIH